MLYVLCDVADIHHIVYRVCLLIWWWLVLGCVQVHIRVASPPLRYPCFMGINIPTRNELIANRLDLQQLAEYIGTKLFFLLLLWWHTLTFCLARLLIFLKWAVCCAWWFLDTERCQDELEIKLNFSTVSLFFQPLLSLSLPVLFRFGDVSARN